jgi:hypothetical protein
MSPEGNIARSSVTDAVRVFPGSNVFNARGSVADFSFPSEPTPTT